MTYIVAAFGSYRTNPKPYIELFLLELPYIVAVEFENNSSTLTWIKLTLTAQLTQDQEIEVNNIITSTIRGVQHEN